MSLADAAWLHMDQPENLMVVTSAAWFEQRLDWERVREILADRLVERFPRFRQRVVEGSSPVATPRWEDDPRFDLGRHLNSVRLAPPGEPAQLQELVAELMATPLDRSRPLWRFELVDGYREGAAIVARIHHCIADGIALARVLLSLTDESPDVGIVPPDEGDRGPLGALPAPAADALSAVRDAAGAVVHEAIEVVRHPDQLVDLATTAREDAGALAKMLLSSPDPRTPLKGELGVPQRVAWSKPVALGEVRERGHATGTTVNDLMLAAAAGALREYMRLRDGDVDELTAIVPFNLRPVHEPLPADLGNRFGLVLVGLPVGIGDRRRRLAEIHRRMQAIKHSHEGAVSYGALGALGSTPEGVEKRVIEQYTSRGTAVITNIPGPPQPVYLAGIPMRGILVWAPRSGSVGMSVTIFSYAGEIVVGVGADAGLIPDPERIAELLERELAALLRTGPASG